MALKIGAIVSILGVFVAVAVAQLGTNNNNRFRGQGHWRDNQKNHARTTPPIMDQSNLDYYANEVQNERDFQAHLDQILIPRVPDTPGSAKVREHIASVLRALDYDVEISEHTQNTPVGRVTFRNVIATLDPAAPRRLVLACHYDTLIKPKGFVGMTDSAVPCSQMLNLAVTLNRDLQEDKANRNEVTLQLIFFDGEEAYKRWSRTDSTYGSRNLADKWNRLPYEKDGFNGNHLDRIDIFVLLDLIGAKDPTFMSLKRNTDVYYNRMGRIEGQLKEMRALRSRKRIFTGQKNFFGGIEDDHVPFEEKGVKILHLIVAPFPDVWHKASDNRRAVDFDSIADINKILRVFVAEYLTLPINRPSNSI